MLRGTVDQLVARLLLQRGLILEARRIVEPVSLPPVLFTRKVTFSYGWASRRGGLPCSASGISTQPRNAIFFVFNCKDDNLRFLMPSAVFLVPCVPLGGFFHSFRALRGPS